MKIKEPKGGQSANATVNKVAKSKTMAGPDRGMPPLPDWAKPKAVNTVMSKKD